MKLATAIAVSLLALCCGDPDCRRKVGACAEGFACTQLDGGSWGCVERRQSAGGSLRRPAEKVTRCDGTSACTGDGVECFCNPAGKLRFRRADTNGDGSIDEQTEFKYNQKGLNHITETDVGVDGVVDVTNTFQHDNEGRPTISEIIYHPDGLLKGENVRVIIVYNDEGAIVSEETNVGMDTTIERRCTFDPPCPPPIPNPTCKPVCKEVKIAPGQDGELENPDGR